MYVLPFECVLVYNSLAICLPKVAKKPCKCAMCAKALQVGKCALCASVQLCTMCTAMWKMISIAGTGQVAGEVLAGQKINRA